MSNFPMNFESLNIDLSGVVINIGTADWLRGGGGAGVVGGDASATATSRAATNGSATAGGAGKTLSSLGLTLNTGFTNGFSGAGGGLGAAGTPSSNDGVAVVSAGGTAGAAIIGASKVIWVNTGNIVGALT